MLSIDPASATPPYEQVRAQLAAMIGDGRLPAGTRLPPVRTLATDLGLAANTVARAYQELEQAGLLVTRGRHGTFVGATGDEVTRQLQRLATEYAERSRQLGVPPAAALDLVRAALDLVPPPQSG